MPTKTPKTDFWISGLRQQLKLTAGVGSAYRISQQSGKCKLDVRYKDNSRSYATLPIDWLPANARRIEETVIAIAQHVAAGKTLKQAVELLFGRNQLAPEPTEDASLVDLVKSFDVIGEEKITDNKIKQSTWDGFYKKIRNKLIYVLSNNEVNNAKTLLKLLATVEMPNSKPNLHKGTRTRQQVIGAVSTWLEYATEKLKKIDGIKIYGESIDKTSVISFNIDGIHAYDLGSILDKFGIAVRTGQHCAQPIMDFFNIPGTIRVSLAFYNTKEEIDLLFDSLKKGISMLS